MKALAGLGMMAAAFIMMKWLIVLAVIFMGVYFLTKSYQTAMIQKELRLLGIEIRRAENDMYRTKADVQNAAYLRDGDIYGDYPPATMPLTNPYGLYGGYR